MNSFYAQNVDGPSLGSLPSVKQPYTDDATRIVEDFKINCEEVHAEAIRDMDLKVALPKLVLFPYRNETAGMSELLNLVEAVKGSGQYWDCLLNHVNHYGYFESRDLIDAFRSVDPN